MRSDERIDGLSDRGKAGKMPIKSQPEAFAAGMTQSKKSGFGSARDFPVGRYVLDGTLECGHRNFRKLGGDFLVRCISHAITGELLPIAHPINAEPAITVIDQKRQDADRGRFA